MVAKWLSRRAHNPKVRGSKPRYALFFVNRDSMAEWIRRLRTDQEIPGSSPGRVDKKFFFLEAQSKNFLLSPNPNPNPNPKGLGLISILTLTLTLIPRG